MPARIKDMIGKRFGRLVVLAEAPSILDKSGRAQIAWFIRCDCGNTKAIRGHSLRDGRSQSCGCMTIERIKETITKHGETANYVRPPVEYNSWAAMKQRCTNPNTHKYPQYGGRGISVCERWLNSFEHFLADMGRKPTPHHSIDRIDNDGNYELENCRWATPAEQRSNTRDPCKRRK